MFRKLIKLYDTRQVNSANYCFNTFPADSISHQLLDFFIDEYTCKNGRELYLLQYVRLLTNFARNYNTITITNKVAAHLVGCSVSTIKRAKRELKERKLINVINNGKYAWNKTKPVTIKFTSEFLNQYQRSCLTKLFPAFGICKNKRATKIYKGQPSVFYKNEPPNKNIYIPENKDFVFDIHHQASIKKWEESIPIWGNDVGTS